MGYMTVISILNDAWETIRENGEEFFNGIERKMMPEDDKLIHDVSVKGYCNYVQVHTSNHASIPVLCLAHQNNLVDINDIGAIRDNDTSMAYHAKILATTKRLVAEAEDSYYEKLATYVLKSIPNAASLSGEDLVNQVKKLPLFKKITTDNKNNFNTKRFLSVVRAHTEK